MPKKRSAAKPKALSPKTRFVLGLPHSLSAIEVVKRAKAAGFTVSTTHVYKMRSAAKHRGAEAAPAPKTAPGLRAIVTSPKLGKPRGKASKTAFVLGLPRHTPAAEVVSKAMAVGLRLTEKYIYNIRSKAKNQRKGAKKANVALELTAAKLAGAAPMMGAIEQQFLDLVLDLGLTKSADLIHRLRERVQRLALG